MEVKEIEEVLKSVLNNPENVELQSNYIDLIEGYFKENKSNSDILTVIVGGIDIDHASNFFDYVETLSKNDIQSLWKQVRENKAVSENKDNNGLKLLTGLLSLAIIKAGNLEGQTGNIIAKLISMIDDEKRPIIEDYYKPILLEYLVEEVLPVDKYPLWDSLKLKGEQIKRFAEIIREITKGEDELKYKNIRQWAAKGIEYSVNLIEKEKIEERIPESKLEELQLIVEHYKVVEKQVRDDAYQMAKLEKNIIGLQKEIEKLNSTNRLLENEISSLNGDVEDQQKKIEEREKEIEERKKINDAADALKKNDEEGLLRDIANDLKAEYRDFIDSESDEMDIQLGEIYREKLKNIFKILAKKGIRME